MEPLEPRAFFSAVPVESPVEMVAPHGLRATYFNDSYFYFAGEPIVLDRLVGLEERYVTGTPDPRVSQPYSALVEGTIRAPVTERFEFFTGNNQVSYLSVRVVDPRNGRVLIDWGPIDRRPNYGGFEYPAGEAQLEAGVDYLVRVLYDGGPVDYRVGWRSPSTPLQVIPIELLSPPGGPPGPKVADVYVNSQAFSPAFREYLGIIGRGQVQRGYRVAESAEDTSLPWFGMDEISVRFDRAVDVGRDDLALRGSDGTVYAVSDFHYDAMNFIATWALARRIDGDRVTLELDGTSDGITGADEAPLDGEWFDAAWRFPPGFGHVGRSFPTGDGSAGGDFRFHFGVLPGDANSDDAVNSADLAEVKRRLNTRSTQWFWIQGFADVTSDGRINAADLAAVKSRLNRRLPPPPPVATAGASSHAAPASELLASPARLRPATRDLFADAPVLP